MLSFALTLRISKPWTAIARVSRLFGVQMQGHHTQHLYTHPGDQYSSVIHSPKLVYDASRLHPANTTKAGGSGLNKNVCW